MIIVNFILTLLFPSLLITSGQVGLSLAQKDEATYIYPQTDAALNCYLASLRGKARSIDPEQDLWLVVQSYLEHIGTGNYQNFSENRRWEEKPQGSYLDVGCGMGRIVSKFGLLFRRVVCLEPDPVRIGIARKFILNESWANTTSNPRARKRMIEFYSTRFMSFASSSSSVDKFDAITSIHVIQHIPTTELDPWLTAMGQLLRPMGVIILATTFVENTRFELSNGRILTAEEFNLHAFRGASPTDQQPQLAVHHFTIRELHDVVRQVEGLSILEFGRFMFSRAFGDAHSQFVVLCRSVDKTAMEVRKPFLNLFAPHVSTIERISLIKLHKILREPWRCRADGSEPTIPFVSNASALSVSQRSYILRLMGNKKLTDHPNVWDNPSPSPQPDSSS